MFHMTISELFLIAAGLSMDAFAVSVSKGLAARGALLKKALLAGLWFGGFQALMPFLGWCLGTRFTAFIQSVDHWVAFILLGIIGLNMIREAREERSNDDACPADDRTDAKTMLPLAVATSIDALAVGVTFAFLEVRVVPASLFIGCVTFAFCFFATLSAGKLGERLGPGAKTAGGAVLILIGLKILLTDLFF